MHLYRHIRNKNTCNMGHLITYIVHCTIKTDLWGAQFVHPTPNSKHQIHVDHQASNVCMHYIKLLSLLSQYILPVTFWPQDVQKLIFITIWWKKHCHTWQHRHKCSGFFKALLHSATATSPKSVMYSEQ
jgi:hypothetical protein